MTELLCTMLVGVPGSGKSTFLRQCQDEFGFVDNTAIISSDKYIEQYAQEAGVTYSEIFEGSVKRATAAMNMELHHAIMDGKNIIWDQTNLNANTRKKKLSVIPAFYVKRAIYFEPPPIEILHERFKNEDRKGKHIPDFILKNMLSIIEPPTEDEGFVDVLTVKNF